MQTQEAHDRNFIPAHCHGTMQMPKYHSLLLDVLDHASRGRINKALADAKPLARTYLAHASLIDFSEDSPASDVR